MGYVYLTLAIAAEIVGTTALKASNEFTNLVPSIVAFVGYGVSLVFLALVLRTIPVGIAYAIWAGVGIAAISVIGFAIFRQPLDFPAILGITLIISGVVVINVQPGSVAGRAGTRNRLMPGDVITRIAWPGREARINSKRDFEQLMARLQTENPWIIRFIFRTKEGEYKIDLQP